MKIKEFNIIKINMKKLQNLVIFKGKKKGIVHTRDISLFDIWKIFFPKGFYQKYIYLGSIPWDEGEFFKMLYPLVLAMDYQAKPKWCPRWFLRFLHLFGNDNSIVRVRNRTLYHLKQKLTKGILIIDFKTKWTDYDLRISVYAPEYLQNLASALEQYYYQKGYREELLTNIKELEPTFKENWLSNKKLSKYLEKLQNNEEENERNLG